MVENGAALVGVHVKELMCVAGKWLDHSLVADDKQLPTWCLAVLAEEQVGRVSTFVECFFEKFGSVVFWEYECENIFYTLNRTFFSKNCRMNVADRFSIQFLVWVSLGFSFKNF